MACNEGNEGNVWILLQQVAFKTRAADMLPQTGTVADQVRLILNELKTKWLEEYPAEVDKSFKEGSSGSTGCSQQPHTQQGQQQQGRSTGGAVGDAGAKLLQHVGDLDKAGAQYPATAKVRMPARGTQAETYKSKGSAFMLGSLTRRYIHCDMHGMHAGAC